VHNVQFDAVMIKKW